MNLRRTVALIIFMASAFTSFSQGLYIKGNYALIDERTSYNVFDKISPTFTGQLNLDFEIIPVRSKGTVVRIKNEESRRVYNISYKSDGERPVFMLNQEGKDNLITISPDKDKSKAEKWIKVHIRFDMSANTVSLRVNNKEASTDLTQSKNSWSPVIYFGRSEHVIDVPDFKLCNVSVGDNNTSYFFPLNESEGESVHDSHRKVIGHVTKPAWLINDAYYWKVGNEFSSGRVAGSNFNPETQEIYYFNGDSLTTYNIQSGRVRVRHYANECPVAMRLGTNFLDLAHNRLYVYEVADPPRGTTTMAYLDLDDFEWHYVTSQVLPMQLHHHSSYMNPETGKYTIFGGFGRTSYFNDFFSFDVDSGSWERQHFTGDAITPRYFTSMGYNDADGCLYLFGGMGNEAGEQAVGRMYYYELYRLNPVRGEIRKVWEIPWNKENVIPVRNMLFPDGEYFYVLCYPEHVSNSRLKLYRFSTADGRYEILGDSIPIVSEKITTNANIYYSEQANSLIAVVQEFEGNDISSTAKVYTISFPPVTIAELAFYDSSVPGNGPYVIYTCLIGLAVVILLVFIYKKAGKRSRKTRRQSSKDSSPVDKPSESQLPGKPRANSIFLFGEFSMSDKQGREINYMLSSKLRQAFFVILYHSMDKGITSHDLSAILWPNKSYEMSKNSRGVTMNNLRKILGELDGISLTHDSEKKSYKIEISQECHCDYLKCLEIVSSDRLDENMDRFVKIISRGKFLQAEDSQSLDRFKGYMESKIESVMYYYMDRSYASGHYNKTILLCESFFAIDPLDKTSLQFLVKSLSRLNMKEEAKRRYYLFTADYKKTLGEEYEKSFSGLLK